MAGYKRRNFFINKDYQGKMIFNYFILVILGSILFIGVFSFFSSNTLSIVYEDYQLHLGMTPGILFKKILSTQWIFIVLGGGVIILITLMLSHRVAGPFFKFERSVGQMIDGDIKSEIWLRTKDEGKGLAEKLNTFNLILSDKLSNMEAFNKDIGNHARTIEALLAQPGENMADILQLLEKIKERQKHIDTLINDYTFTR